MKEKGIYEYKYKDWKIYTIDKNYYNIAESIIEKKITVEKIIKDTHRNTVKIIEFNEKKYICKEIKSEIVIPQRKIQTLWKKGEALTTLLNGKKVIDSGIKEIAMPLIAIIKKDFFIVQSYLVVEYIENIGLSNLEDIDKVVDIIKKIHRIGRYHGDCNTSNFIKDNDNNIYTIDTQLKKSFFFGFNQWYDILNLKEDLLVCKLKYDVTKKFKVIYNIGYFLAAFLKSIKKLKIISIVRRQKKNLRKKGWKI